MFCSHKTSELRFSKPGLLDDKVYVCNHCHNTNGPQDYNYRWISRQCKYAAALSICA